jgi:hypothetical protein
MLTHKSSTKLLPQTHALCGYNQSTYFTAKKWSLVDCKKCLKLKPKARK